MFVPNTDADYKILEIEPSASNEDLKKAYRRMAMKFHPDKVSHLGEDFQNAAKEKFQKVSQAYENIKKETLIQVRGTVQADILKEDQAQNTCIFSTEFALRLMGDVQEYFIKKQVRNFYSVSISFPSFLTSKA